LGVVYAFYAIREQGEFLYPLKRFPLPMPRVIVVVGLPGSGKEVFAEVAREYGYRILRMGDVVREEARRQGLDLVDGNVGTLANSEREKHGLGVWAERTIPRLEGKTVIDGCRGDAELKVFRETLGRDMMIVAVDAPPEVRFERIVARGRKDAAVSWEHFRQRDERERSWGIGRALELAEVTIQNDGTLEEFQAKARALLDTWVVDE